MTFHADATNHNSGIQNMPGASPLSVMAMEVISGLETLRSYLQHHPRNPSGDLFKVRGLIENALAAAGVGKMEAPGPGPMTQRPEIRLGGLAGWQCRAIETYLAARLGQKISVSDMASAARLSHSHFARVFRQTYGISPMKYLLQLRVRAAQGCMMRSNLPLCEIALEFGFCDQAHFSRAFREITGETPSQWSRRCR